MNDILEPELADDVDKLAGSQTVEPNCNHRSGNHFSERKKMLVAVLKVRLAKDLFSRPHQRGQRKLTSEKKFNCLKGRFHYVNNVEQKINLLSPAIQAINKTKY